MALNSSMTPDEALADLRKLLNGINVTDDMLSRGVRLTDTGTAKIAKRYGIEPNEVPQMIQDCADMVKKDLSEDEARFSYEADFMGNLTLRDAQTGESKFLQGDEAFELGKKLEAQPDMTDMLIADYFDGDNQLNEFMDTSKLPDLTADSHGVSDVEATGTDAPPSANTFNFPYKDGLATARFWMEGTEKKVKVVSYRKHETDDEIHITAAMREKLNAVALTWWDKV